MTPLGETRWVLVDDGPIWIRYDINEHLALRGTAPRLHSRPTTSNAFVRLFPDGLVATNADTFAKDRHLLFRHGLPPGRAFNAGSDTATVELDLEGVPATSGLGAGEVRARAFETIGDAIRARNPLSLDKRGVVLKVAYSLRLVSKPLRQRAKATSGFLQFGVGSRVPIGGFDFTVEDGHPKPDGRPAGTDLEEYNVDIKKSVITFSGSGGFAFAPLKDGWTVETVDPNSGPCRGDAKLARGDPDANPPVAAQPSRTIHPVSFGTNGRDYPAGPATTPMVRGSWHLCATVPADNMEFLPEADYHVGATFVAKDTARPFPPRAAEDDELRLGTIWYDGLAINVPLLTTDPAYLQDLIVVNRHRRLVDYTLVVNPGPGGTARPRVLSGELRRSGQTRPGLADLSIVTGTTEATALLAIVSLPNMIDGALNTVNRRDGSTDVILLFRGLHDAPLPSSAIVDPNVTIVHVPEVVTAPGHAQRLTIQNRLWRRAPYTLTLHPGEGATATPDRIRGGVPARGVVTLRLHNETELSDGWGAATLRVSAPARRVEVSTTIVNRADGSVDTVVLHRGGWDG